MLECITYYLYNILFIWILT